jgi:hypothetical protein
MKLQKLLGYEPPDFVAHQPTFPFPSKGGFFMIRQVEERPVISHFARDLPDFRNAPCTGRRRNLSKKPHDCIFLSETYHPTTGTSS